MELLLLILVILLFAGVGPWWPHSRSWGYGPVGILVVIVLVVVVARVLGVV